MAVPKKKTSKGRTSRRHNAYVVKQQKKLSNAVALTDCEQCGAKRRVHHVCAGCGYYKGTQVVDKVTKALDKVKTIKA